MQSRKFTDEQILELIQQGLNQTQIAEALNVSPAAISKRLRKINPNVPGNGKKPNRQERLRDKLLAISCAPVDGWTNDRDRMEILASLMAKHIDPIQVCAAFTISRDEYQRYLENPHYQQRLEYYRNLAEKAPENAIKLAQGSAFDMMLNVAAIARTSNDPRAIVQANKMILEMAGIIPKEKPKITFNFNRQEINLMTESLPPSKAEPKKLTGDTDNNDAD